MRLRTGGWSLLLIAAIAPIPFLMHRYWAEEGETRMNEQV